MSNPMNYKVAGGNLVKVPEIKKFSKGTSYCNVSLAVDRIGSDNSDFISVRLTGAAAETFVKYADKGRLVIFAGEHRQGLITEGKDKGTFFSYLLTSGYKWLDKPKTRKVEGAAAEAEVAQESDSEPF